MAEFEFHPAFLELVEFFEADISGLENPKKDTIDYWAKSNVAAQTAVAESMVMLGLGGTTKEKPTIENSMRTRLKSFAPWDVVTDSIDAIGDVIDTAGATADAAWAAADGMVKIAGFGAAVVSAAGDVAAAGTDLITATQEGASALADQLIPEDLPSLDEVGQCIGESGDDALLGAAIGGGFLGSMGYGGGKQFFDDMAAGTAVGEIPGGPGLLFNPSSGGIATVTRLLTDSGGAAVGMRVLSPIAQGAMFGIAGAVGGGLVGGAIGTMSCLLNRDQLGDRIPVVAHNRDGVAVRTYWRRRPSDGSTAGGMTASSKRRFIATGTFKEKTMPTSTATRHGEHATEAPPHMLTDVRFELVRLDERTPDGRLIHSSGFGVRDLPLSFSAMFTTQHSPGEAVLVGSIDEVTIEEDGRVWGQGWLLDEPDARRAGRLIQAGALRGNSVELSAEKVDLVFDETDEKLLVDFVSSKLAATTLVANPAMESCVVELITPDFDFGEDAELTDAVSTLASFTDLAPSVFSTTAPEKPRTDLPNGLLFEDPEFTGPTQVTVDKDGAVYGHIALWDTPHLGSPAMTPPQSAADYAYFTVGEVLTDSGFVATGPLVIGDEHAAINLGWRAAVDFYAATSRAWADVAVGEDDYGIWVAGMVRPGTDDATVHAARASGVSGDWRRIGGHLELVAVLSVNTPGFPVPQTELSDGRPMALVGIGHRFAPAVGLLQTVSADFALTVERFDQWLNRAEADRIRHNLEREMRREAKDIASTL